MNAAGQLAKIVRNINRAVRRNKNRIGQQLPQGLVITEKTMTEALGTTGAISLALVGVALTVWSIWYIKTRLIPNQIAWKETPALAEEVIASESKEQA